MHMLTLQTDSLSVHANWVLLCNNSHDHLHASSKSCGACAGPHVTSLCAAQHCL